MKVEIVSKPLLIAIAGIPAGDNFIWDGHLYIRTPDTQLVSHRIAVGVNLGTGNHLVIEKTTRVEPVRCKAVKY